MSYSLFVLHLAKKDMAKAAVWYEARRPGLGERLIEEFNSVFAALKEDPLLHSTVAAVIRQVVLKVFPYAVHFRVEDRAIYVIACLHQRRNPAVWKRRSKRRF